MQGNTCSDLKSTEPKTVFNCSVPELDTFIETIDSGLKFTVLDTFCRIEDSIILAPNGPVRFMFSGYLMTFEQFGNKFTLGLYTLEEIKDKTIFYEFFMESGVVKAPFIFIEDGKFIYSLSTQLLVNKNQLIHLFEKIEPEMRKNYPKCKVIGFG